MCILSRFSLPLGYRIYKPRDITDTILHPINKNRHHINEIAIVKNVDLLIKNVTLLTEIVTLLLKHVTL